MFACRFATALFIAAAVLSASARAEMNAAEVEAYKKVDSIFADYALDNHVPGVVYGVVADGKLVYVRGIGVQDFESKRPVTADTLFRIASMTKAFTALTILKLRDEGKLQLDAPAENYIEEMRGWKYPTQDSSRISVRDLLNHTAGFVTDDPWGDRQTPMPEAEFTRLMRDGVPFTRTPGTAWEYSNLGYAMLGRIITNASGKPYAETISQSLLNPLGMKSSGFFVDAAPRERRALGYRWEDETWRLEPTMEHGAFGAMGGLQTSANDYAKWVAYLLSAWPPGDSADTGPVKRASIRELGLGSGIPRVFPQRVGHPGQGACPLATSYGMGFIVSVGCDFGVTMSHGGGYPGYGSHVLLIPQKGLGFFALTNRTYGGPSGAVWDAAAVLTKTGVFKDRALPVSDELARAYRAVGSIYNVGNVTNEKNQLAMNFLMDRDAAGWSRDLAALRKAVGDCDTSAAINATGALAGEFKWRCKHGRVSGSVLLAPTKPATIQQIKLEVQSR